METKEKFLLELLDYNANYDTDLIGKAYDTAARLHEGQFRKSKEPYIVHPVATAKILASLGMDDETIVGGLLHDVVEDTAYTREELVSDFGEDIALLVDGVTKLGVIKFDNREEAQAENLRKMFLAMSKDIRVLIIKLADRLHNMRTAQYWTPEKQKEKARETLDIYAPLADRLGIYTVKFELENLALKYLNPDIYESLSNKISKSTAEREKFIDEVIAKISKSLDAMGIHYEISGRAKHIYSVYKKMVLQHKQLDEIFDLTAVRVIVDSVKDCYAVLGQVHTMWKPIPGRFKDYIAMPKPNMYQSLHTTVIGDEGEPFEIQIRTFEMHEVAEYGIAAHWKYKSGVTDGKQSNEDLKLAWLRQTLEWQQDLQEQDMDDPTEFMETLKMDLFSSQVFVFTPNGEVIDLPAGSTPIDFAFKIHTDIGYKCVGAKVNGKMVTIDYPLNNGDIVEIVTSPKATGPSPDWLKIVKSSTARTKIRQFLRKANKSDDIARGKEALDKYIRHQGYDPKEVAKASKMTQALKKIDIAGNFDNLYVQIGKNNNLLAKYAGLLFQYYDEEAKFDEKRKNEREKAVLLGSAKKEKEDHERRNNPGIVVKGVSNLMIRIAKCCNPVPGDDIVGFITKGRGVSVHRKDCSNITSLPEEMKERFIEVEWEDLEQGKSYNADIRIRATDRKRMFADISRVCEDMDIHISGVSARSGKDGTVYITLTLSISSTQEMQKVLRNIRMIDGVKDVYRVKF
jgi:guanosine-3',5'-bis(diphosphate) 3'-pyrophosphohydrolase